ncbi:hypothetical protein RND81_01G077900 [Saponaria officinalis]|uniref:DUF7953 domain-containing protein n=1 Tax=Saponaria officinalis TaxID=3572 RepID=A0AAW1NF32_SAPOF
MKKPKLMLCSMSLGFSTFGFLLWIHLISFSGNVSAALVTLHSIRLYKTHELIGKPKVYFQCKGETNTLLPDVKKAKVEYSFKGEESWQPLTEFLNKKCKRCKLYEKDKFPWSHTDILDEWEFCPSDFTSPDAKCTIVKAKKFNATFSCPTCPDLGVVGFIGGYMFWKKRKMKQEQLRFMKLFEEQDDLEDEFGLGDDI